ncbi:mmar_2319 family lipooligosaccharide biosynthesis protein [Mycobacterium marinum]|uniref:mmar_2319 family lipooligosaccharide biosynthesis protein n=1 Tax=Mycobacterium marinum TaxID=1781 RepID=UPI0003090ACC|nr:hypothetical protein [Mycobacterium marinum]GJO19598.1 hypothetical protein NJB1507_13600 [Mycobacterium marinum]
MSGEVTDSSPPAAEPAEETGPSTARRRALKATAAAFFCLGIWALSPIYPDEIAYRQQFGRIIPDHGVIYGLYEMCPSNIKTVPLVLEPVAWLLGQTMSILSPLEMRILSFAAVLAVVFMAVRQAASNRNPAAGYLVLASFVGVAGAGLIFVRYEFALELQLLSCLVAAARLTSRRTGVAGDLGVAIGLLLAAALSVWSHVQGLLFLPLTAYLLARLAVRRFGSVGLLAAAVPFVLFVPPAMKLHHSVCTEHPEIEAFWRSLAFDGSDLGARNLAVALANTARSYVGSFVYAPLFPIRFLPGVDAPSGPITVMNLFITVVVVLLAGLVLYLLTMASIRCGKSIRFRSRDTTFPERFEKNQPVVIAALITLPVAILFVYDAQHAFYRNFYLNHLTSVAACLILASVSGPLALRFTKGASVLVGIVVGASLIFNAFLFVRPLANGYEGPSLSVLRRWPQVSRDTAKLARVCKMDLGRGRIIVDDLTQAGVYSRPMTIPLTYLHLQANLVGMSAHDAAIEMKANYAILRCPDFDVLGVAPQGRTGDVCCYTFG